MASGKALSTMLECKNARRELIERRAAGLHRLLERALPHLFNGFCDTLITFLVSDVEAKGRRADTTVINLTEIRWSLNEMTTALFTMDLKSPFVYISNREIEKGADNRVVQKKKPGFCFLTIKVLSNNQAFPHVVKLCKSGGNTSCIVDDTNPLHVDFVVDTVVRVINSLFNPAV